jgi:hypothetical protein
MGPLLKAQGGKGENNTVKVKREEDPHPHTHTIGEKKWADTHRPASTPDRKEEE